MSDIDWLAVDFVCQGATLKLRAAEKAAVVRRMDDRMLGNGQNVGPVGKLSAAQLAERLCTTEKSVQRFRSDLPLASRDVCRVCREPIWVVVDTGLVEAHPDRLMVECPMSGKPMPRGLAAVRPDLYRWAVPA